MRYTTCAAAVTSTLALFVAHARADAGYPADTDVGSSTPLRFDASANARQGMMLPSLVAPGSDQATPVTATMWTGYDTARDSIVLRSFVDATLYGPFAVRAGISYLPDTTVTTAQPRVGARLSLLHQAQHGIDLGVAAFYRLERFTQEDGLLQAVVSGAVHLGNTGLFANLVYGQDAEGDDREGEVRFAMLHAMTPAVELGFEGRARLELPSDDPKREDHPVADVEASLAPTLTYAVGPLAVFAQAGPAAVHTKQWRLGVLAMAGLGASL